MMGQDCTLKACGPWSYWVWMDLEGTKLSEEKQTLKASIPPSFISSAEGVADRA